MIDYDIRPAKYDISADSSGHALRISMPTKAAKQLTEILSNPSAPFVQFLGENLGLQKFVTPSEENWGYGQVLKKIGDKRPNWVSWQCLIPKVGQRLTVEDWKILYSTSASLNVFFTGAEAMEGGGDSSVSQLTTLGLITETKSLGGSIYGRINTPMILWLMEQTRQYVLDCESRVAISDDRPYLQALKAMRGAYAKMSGQKSHSHDFFRVRYTPPKYVFLSCPGSACDIGAEMSYADNEVTGYEISSHNCDNPQQQLTLLIGLGVLHKFAREADFKSLEDSPH